jgi:hypothetical protein
MWRHVYLPLALQIAGLTALGVLAAWLSVLLVTGPHAELILLIVPAAAGVAGWLRTPKVAPLRRRSLLQAAIDKAPHRFERPARPRHRLYGTWVESEDDRVVVALVYREPGSKKVTILERRNHRGDELEDAAASVAAVDERAAQLEREVRDRRRAERQAAERERHRQAQEAEDARLRAIDDQHARELAEREDQLRAEDARSRRREAELEAEALAKALRREP